jgi:hypothetical protein
VECRRAPESVSVGPAHKILIEWGPPSGPESLRRNGELRIVRGHVTSPSFASIPRSSVPRLTRPVPSPMPRAPPLLSSSVAPMAPPRASSSPTSFVPRRFAPVPVPVRTPHLPTVFWTMPAPTFSAVLPWPPSRAGKLHALSPTFLPRASRLCDSTWVPHARC